LQLAQRGREVRALRVVERGDAVDAGVDEHERRPREVDERALRVDVPDKYIEAISDK
jgi:hypothetical protein